VGWAIFLGKTGGTDTGNLQLKCVWQKKKGVDQHQYASATKELQMLHGADKYNHRSRNSTTTAATAAIPTTTSCRNYFNEFHHHQCFTTRKQQKPWYIYDFTVGDLPELTAWIQTGEITMMTNALIASCRCL